MERRNIDILCLQETKWKSSKAMNIGGRCKIFYNGADGRKNGIGIVLGLPTVTSFNKGYMENRYKHNFQSHLYHCIYASVACGDL